MFPFWEIAIAPVLDAVRPRRVVEIGALRGETTTLLLDRLGEDAELHVIDPVPAFDPTEHEKQFPGRYIFHRDISHDVLPGLGAVDVALVDGDHNWYTVYHELRILRESARAAGEPLPVIVMHDVLWPYGRRDLYYAPERIPGEFRQPYAQRGMQPRRVELLPPGRGGLSPTMNNALKEGGPRNGVMTALDDFVDEHDQPVRRLVLPIYFGLAVVADEERLARHPELAALLDHLEGADARHDLLELSEQLRIKALVFQHGVFYSSEARYERSAKRYLDVLKGSLLDEYGLENDVRLSYALTCMERGQAPDPLRLHDPARHLRDDVRKAAVARQTGTVGPEEPAMFPYTAMGRQRLDHLERCLDTVRTEAVAGDLVECGVQRAGGAIFLRGYLEAYEMAHRDVWVADPFRGLPGAEDDDGDERLAGDLNIVREGFSRFKLLDDRVRFLQGDYRHTLVDAPVEKVALLRIGPMPAADVVAVLDALYDRLTVGGFVVIDDGGDAASRDAVEAYRRERGIDDVLERVDWAATGWRKTRPAGRAAAATTVAAPARAPLPVKAAAPRKDLSVIVVFYNMRREAERTLHSLSRAYQQGVDDLDYEVVVVENGSAEEEKLGDEFVRSFGPEFSYLDLGDDATPSPAAALNRGLKEASGDAVAMMIDGAHVLTPGVLRFGVLGLNTYEPAIVATQQWYVGPGQQPETMPRGYDEPYEDRLFEQIGWPGDGYALFDIGHFIGDRDWFDGMWESNCIFAPRSLLEQVGAMDESFSMAGGGYANLDFYERLGATPGVTVVSILGEASFHQVHGGTTTNEPDVDERNRRLASYAEHYGDLRGRTYRGPGKPIHYVGGIVPSARRTRARRMSAPAFFRGAQAIGADGRPTEPVPLPDELKLEFVDAFWRSFVWQGTTWLGHKVRKAPTDLFVYQELVASVRPDWIIETGVGAGGRALFLATMCDLVGHGRVLALDARTPERVPAHERLTYLREDPLAEGVAARVAELVGPDPRALLVLGLGSRDQIVRQFAAYEPLVPVGSFVVVEDTIMNGNPIWPAMGPGPAEAVKEITRKRSDFAPDPELERFGLTFNPGGFLRRLR